MTQVKMLSNLGELKMSLLQLLTGEVQVSDIQLEPAEAFGAIVIITVAADGIITASELKAITAIFTRMKSLSQYSEYALMNIKDKLIERIKNKEIKPLFDAAVAAVPQDLKKTLFAVTTDLVLADGEYGDKEDQILNKLCSALNISDEMAEKIIDVIFIKNKMIE